MIKPYNASILLRPDACMSLTERFATLTSLLHQHAVFWRHFPFREPVLSWAAQQPQLVRELLALADSDIEVFSTDAVALTGFFAPHLPFATELLQACTLPALPSQPLPPITPRLHAGIPGRKWQQIERFVAALPQEYSRQQNSEQQSSLQTSSLQKKLPVLEWCAGKSHLGFLLQHCSGQPVTALEWNAGLVAQANARALQWQCDLHSHAVDVLSGAAEPFVQAQQQIVALHACGDLHVRLLHLCVRQQVNQLQLSPCCYQKIAAEHYQPLSQAARLHPLPLSKNELHIAVTETVTAGGYERRQRLRLQAMRLGFDALQRAVRGVDEFLPVPSLPGEWARVDFRTLCEHCAHLKNLPLPASIEWDFYEEKGWQRLREVSALDLVRFLFRRPLEVWLVLDRALFLQENGYRVRVGTFCERSATPRNILIDARHD